MEKQALLTIKKNKNGSCIILIQYCKEGVFLQSTGVTLKLNETQVDFFKRKQRLPSNVPNYEILNVHLARELDKFNSLTNRFFSSFRKYPTKSELESYLRFSPESSIKKSADFVECLSLFIERKSRSRDSKQYKTLHNHLIEFIKWKNLEGKKIYFSTLQVDFFKEFFTFLSLRIEFRYEGKVIRKKAMCDNALRKFTYSIASSITQIKKYQIADYDRNEILDHIRVAAEELNITPFENKEIVLSHHEIEILTNFSLKDASITNKRGEVIKYKSRTY
jgi:hypothetical protein